MEYLKRSYPIAELERTLFDVAREIANLTGQQHDRDYLTIWREYYHDNNHHSTNQ